MRIRLACLAALVLSTQSFAQSLADKVPADTVVYFGWRGTLDPGPGYAGSKLEAVLKDSQLGRLIDETLPAAGLAADRRFPAQQGTFGTLGATLSHVLRRPSAVFLAFDGDRPRGGLFCRPAGDAKAFTQLLQQLAAAMPANVKASVVTSGDAVGFVLGGDNAADVAGGLADRAEFKKGLSHCLKDPSTVAFIDVAAARKMLGAVIAKNASTDVADRYTRFMDASGLNGVNAITSADGFAGREWQTDVFVDAPTPRKGLLAFDASGPIDVDLLKRVPASANVVNVVRLDANKALKAVRDVAAATDPQAGDVIDKALGAATLAIGKNVQNDLLASLGTQWAAYTSPDIGGSAGTGIVLVNKLANPLKAKQSIAAVSNFLSSTSQNLLRQQNIVLAGRMTKVGDLSVYYAATPFVSPAWVIADGYLYVGLYPQTVIAAARYSGPAINENEGFAAATKLNEAAAPLSLSYVDTKATLDDGYTSALALSRTLFGLSDMFLATTPEPLLPPLAALRAQAGPAGQAAWADDGGLHVRVRSPFPGAEALSQLSLSSLYLNNLPVMAGTLLPSLNHSREAANRIKSASNLRQIGLGCKMFANDNRKAAYPADFNELLHTQELTADVFINPRRDTTLPPVPTGEAAVDFYGKWAVEQGDYVYCGAGHNDAENADNVLAYEKPEGLTDGINVLFVDGHVDFVSFAELPKVFAASGLTLPTR